MVHTNPVFATKPTRTRMMSRTITRVASLRRGGQENAAPPGAPQAESAGTVADCSYFGPQGSSGSVISRPRRSTARGQLQLALRIGRGMGVSQGMRPFRQFSALRPVWAPHPVVQLTHLRAGPAAESQCRRCSSAAACSNTPALFFGTHHRLAPSSAQSDACQHDELARLVASCAPLTSWVYLVRCVAFGVQHEGVVSLTHQWGGA